MWLSNTSTAAMVMPIVEAVAQQIISAQAEVEATQMTSLGGSTNHGLEIDGITWRPSQKLKRPGVGSTGHTSRTCI